MSSIYEPSNADDASTSAGVPSSTEYTSPLGESSTGRGLDTPAYGLTDDGYSQPAIESGNDYSSPPAYAPAAPTYGQSAPPQAAVAPIPAAPYPAPYEPVQQSAPPQYGQYPANPGYATASLPNGMAIASMCCSILGIFSYTTGAILGIVFGHIALNEIKKGRASGRGYALAGLWIGYTVLIGGLLILFFVVVLPFILMMMFGMAGVFGTY